MNVLKSIVCLIAFLSTIHCFSAPAAVFIIRHGEKELALDSQSRPIVKNGKQKYTKYLSLRGWQRAHAISFDRNFFDNSEFGVPVAIFASAPSSITASIRPIETVTPLANRLNLKVDSQFKPGEQPKLADFIMKNKAYDGKLIILSFEHHHIPGLAEAFKVTNAPKVWPDDVFDRIWEIRFDIKSGNVLSFSNNPQKLLFGDAIN